MADTDNISAGKVPVNHPAAAAASGPKTEATAAPAVPAAAAAKIEAKIDALKDTPAFSDADKKKLETRIAELEDELHRLRTAQGLVHKTKKSGGWIPLIAVESEN